MASALLVAALALATAGCREWPGRGPADARPPAPAAVPAREAAPAWVGDAVDLGGRGYGEHLRIAVLGQVDPAVPARATAAEPPAGTRRIGARLSVLNFGGRPFDASRARTWVEDADGRRHRPVATGTLTTGRPLAWNTLAVGEQRDGWLVYQVPERARIVRLHCAAGGRTVSWQLRFPPRG
ncbi:DUF4352 domain-containing protein [Streptomyces yaizuensis]|uniref:DUF4352 domain-containing protein n=1 Tax=Streptomyces yaizuensis TaxID=2989713 RepID=A0ABQ5NWI6_9ACTN|nr:DUF4352 domain-containing protein [Streptomyces sp. YSPA8]GLF94356.1 DUF4352 domain-containing protein [Streptomyces sp. YSPA8]